jgi:hypothetical protein
MAMAKYSLRFLNDDNRIDDVEIIDCDGDKSAQVRASFLFGQRNDFPRIEVWLDGRLVFSQDKKAA